MDPSELRGALNGYLGRDRLTVEALATLIEEVQGLRYDLRTNHIGQLHKGAPAGSFTPYEVKWGDDSPPAGRLFLTSSWGMEYTCDVQNIDGDWYLHWPDYIPFTPDPDDLQRFIEWLESRPLPKPSRVVQRGTDPIIHIEEHRPRTRS